MTAWPRRFLPATGRSAPRQARDARFAEVFAFLDGYNFTISEDTPLDQEVAVDPEMIGKVYEAVVNLVETRLNKVESLQRRVSEEAEEHEA